MIVSSGRRGTQKKKGQEEKKRGVGTLTRLDLGREGRVMALVLHCSGINNAP
jgi:hypothetical protein